MPEELDSMYVRPEVLARLFGFSGVRRIQQLTQDGVLHTQEVRDEKGKPVNRYHLATAVEEYVAHLSEKANGKAKRTAKEQELKARIM